MNQNETLLAGRITALDNVRVIAICILVVYHHCMIYVPEWGFHFKNPVAFSGLQNLMLLTSPWRMGVLWLVSGISLRFMLAKVATLEALYHRTRQLLFPLFIAVLFIVPPQLYVEMKQAGEMPLSYIDFLYSLFFDQQTIFENFSSGIWPGIDVNHLWFLRSLWQFSLLAIALHLLLRNQRVSNWLAYIAGRPAVIFLLACLGTWMVHDQLEGEAIREAYGLLLFLLGFVFGRYEVFIHAMKKAYKPFLWLAILSLLSVQLFFAFLWQPGKELGWINSVASIVYIINKSLLPLAILSIALYWSENTKSNLVAYSKEVFPIYILHQSLSIVIAFTLIQFAFTNWLPNYIQMLFGFFLVIVLLWLALKVIQRIDFLRVCFGAPLSKTSAYSSSKVNALLFLACVPIGLAILF